MFTVSLSEIIQGPQQQCTEQEQDFNSLFVSQSIRTSALIFLTKSVTNVIAGETEKQNCLWILGTTNIFPSMSKHVAERVFVQLCIAEQHRAFSE